ncbi:hypothetical protein CCH79_00004687, partial [Gambusia affinis]
MFLAFWHIFLSVLKRNLVFNFDKPAEEKFWLLYAVAPSGGSAFFHSAPDLSSTMKESPSKQDTNLDSSVSSAPDLSCFEPIDKLPPPVWSTWNKSQEESTDSCWRDLSTTLTSSSILLTGDKEVDSDILAFVMARKNLLSRI